MGAGKGEGRARPGRPRGHVCNAARTDEGIPGEPWKASNLFAPRARTRQCWEAGGAREGLCGATRVSPNRLNWVTRWPEHQGSKTMNHFILSWTKLRIVPGTFPAYRVRR